MYARLRSFDEIQDSSIHARALLIFERFAKESRAVYTLSPAINGIGLIRGPAEATRRWLNVLQDPEPALVRYALGALGRTRDGSLFGPIGELLKHRDEEVRFAAIGALGYLGILGDRRAIPMLVPLLADKTEAGEVDNHGPMQTVGDLAHEALQKLEKV